MGVTRASKSAGMPRAAVIFWLAQTLACVACSHPWDDYVALDAGQGGAAGQGASSPSTICTNFCTVYRQCVAAWSTCEAECVAEVSQCPVAARQVIQNCVDAQQGCTGQIAEQVVFYECITTGQQCLQMQSPY